MSGFFLVKRNIIDQQASKLTGLGFKILLDILSSAKNQINYKEIEFCFKERKFGEFKFKSSGCLGIYALIMGNKVGKFIPARFVSF